MLLAFILCFAQVPPVTSAKPVNVDEVTVNTDGDTSSVPIFHSTITLLEVVAVFLSIEVAYPHSMPDTYEFSLV